MITWTCKSDEEICPHHGHPDHSNADPLKHSKILIQPHDQIDQHTYLLIRRSAPTHPWHHPHHSLPSHNLTHLQRHLLEIATLHLSLTHSSPRAQSVHRYHQRYPMMTSYPISTTLKHPSFWKKSKKKKTAASPIIATNRSYTRLTRYGKSAPG